MYHAYNYYRSRKLTKRLDRWDRRWSNLGAEAHDHHDHEAMGPMGSGRKGSKLGHSLGRKAILYIYIYIYM